MVRERREYFVAHSAAERKCADPPTGAPLPVERSSIRGDVALDDRQWWSMPSGLKCHGCGMVDTDDRRLSDQTLFGSGRRDSCSRAEKDGTEGGSGASKGKEECGM